MATVPKSRTLRTTTDRSSSPKPGVKYTSVFEQISRDGRSTPGRWVDDDDDDDEGATHKLRRGRLLVDGVTHNLLVAGEDARAVEEVQVAHVVEAVVREHHVVHVRQLDAVRGETCALDGLDGNAPPTIVFL